MGGYCVCVWLGATRRRVAPLGVARRRMCCLFVLNCSGVYSVCCRVRHQTGDLASACVCVGAKHMRDDHRGSITDPEMRPAPLTDRPCGPALRRGGTVGGSLLCRLGPSTLEDPCLRRLAPQCGSLPSARCLATCAVRGSKGALARVVISHCSCLSRVPRTGRCGCPRGSLRAQVGARWRRARGLAAHAPVALSAPARGPG